MAKDKQQVEINFLICGCNSTSTALLPTYLNSVLCGFDVFIRQSIEFLKYLYVIIVPMTKKQMIVFLSAFVINANFEKYVGMK